MPQEATKIQIIISIASFIYNEGRGLFIAGTGEDVYGNDVPNVFPETETIPMDTDGYRWAQAATRFIRFVVHTLGASILERHQIMDESISDAFLSGIDIAFQNDSEEDSI